MEKQSRPAPDAALRCARASLLLTSLRRPRASSPPPKARRSSSDFSSSASTECALGIAVRLHRGEVEAARREAAGHARIAVSELLLVLDVAPVVLLLLLLLGLL
uniref:Uncharacterized protein n=1 Tax=Arundo donax TaxID=35708 RepID=A0A0A8YIM4_ARUDO